MDKLELAGCILQDSEGKILLIHRHSTGRIQWELPGGKVENNEENHSAAKRELAEELALTVEIKREIGRKQFTEENTVMNYIWFLAKITQGEPVIMEPDKFDKLYYFSWNDLNNMRDELSANTKNLLDAYNAKEIII